MCSTECPSSFGSEPRQFDVLVFMPAERTKKLFVAQRHQEFLTSVAIHQPRIAEVSVQMHNMRDREGYVVRYGITEVPTWVFLRDGIELGRIVREPHGSFSEEIDRIITASIPK